MAQRLANRLQRVRAPELGPISRTGDQAPAVGTEGHGMDPAGRPELTALLTVALPDWRAVRSASSVRIVFPSGLIATDWTQWACSSGLPTASPVLVSHNRAVLSVPAVAIMLPSELKATDRISPPCGNGSPSGRPELASQRRGGPTRPPVSSTLPSGLKAAACTSPPCSSTEKSSKGCARAPRGSCE